jgi:parallel beta helix pectate lyase-like protein
VKAIDFRALIKNQWVLVLSLVALVSFFTTVIDIFTGRLGGSSAQKRVDSAGKRTWMLDAGGGRGTDGKEFSEIINNVGEGDTIELKPGVYNGPPVIARSIHIVGQSASSGERASIHYTAGLGMTVTAAQINVDNVEFTQTSAGQSGIIVLSGQTIAQINKCSFLTRGSYCIFGQGSARVVVQDSKFQSFNQGTGFFIKESVNGTLERCTFEENQEGGHSEGASNLTLNDCTFQKNTPTKAGACVFILSSGNAQINGCHFSDNENAAPIQIGQSDVTVNNCIFERNSGSELGFAIQAHNAATLHMSNCTFTEDKRPVVIKDGSRLFMESCRFDKCGESSKSIAGANLLIEDKNSQATIKKTEFSDVQYAGVLVADEAQLTMQDSTVSGGQYGIDLGTTKEKGLVGGSATLQNVTITGAIGQMVRATRSSKLTMVNCKLNSADAYYSAIYLDSGANIDMSGCEVQGGKRHGLEAVGTNTQVSAKNCKFFNFQNAGVLARRNARATLDSCTLEQNDIGAEVGDGTDPRDNATLTLQNCTVSSNRTFGVSAVQRAVLVLSAITYNDQITQIHKDPSAAVRDH